MTVPTQSTELNDAISALIVAAYAHGAWDPRERALSDVIEHVKIAKRRLLEVIERLSPKSTGE